MAWSDKPIEYEGNTYLENVANGKTAKAIYYPTNLALIVPADIKNLHVLPKSVDYDPLTLSESSTDFSKKYLLKEEL